MRPITCPVAARPGRPQKMSLNWPPLSATRDAGDYLVFERRVFRGLLLRWIFRLYTERISPAGRGFLGATLLFLHFAICSLEIQAYVAFSYAVALWAAAAGAAFLFRPRVLLTAHLPDRVGAG